MSVVADESKPFDGFAVLHLFGRHTVASRLTEMKVAGKDFARLDIPAVGDHQARTVLYSPDAIYDLEPVDEETARMVAAMHQPADPVSTYSARRLLGIGTSQFALGAPDPGEGQGSDDEDDIEYDDEALYR
jgi:hypothetical protein